MVWIAAAILLKLLFTMDARTTAALATALRESNCDAARENALLRRVVERAATAVSIGDRAEALRLLALALHGSAVQLTEPRPRGRRCVLCFVRKRSYIQMPATGRWAGKPTDDRLLCRPCWLLQPP